MKIITESMVEKHLTMPICIEAMRAAMIAVSNGDTTLPIRQYMPIPNVKGKMALMPGTIGEPHCYGIKLVCKYERDHDSPYGTHVGMVLVFDSKIGVPLAMIEGASLTGIRTAAASALATDLMAKPECDTLVIIGNGEQAKRHIHAMLAVRNPKHIRVWGRDIQRATRFAQKMSRETGREVKAHESLEDTIRTADIVCTTTAAKTPFIKGEWVQPGSHVNLVGAAIASSAEVDHNLVVKSRFVTDYRPAAMAAAGELLDAIAAGVVTADHIIAEIGEVAAGRVKGRTSGKDITVYKSLGVAAQDLAAGYYLYEQAVQKGFGQDINMMDG
jgi:ornithine cyclodeaminase